LNKAQSLLNIFYAELQAQFTILKIHQIMDTQTICLFKKAKRVPISYFMKEPLLNSCWSTI